MELTRAKLDKCKSLFYGIISPRMYKLFWFMWLEIIYPHIAWGLKHINYPPTFLENSSRQVSTCTWAKAGEARLHFFIWKAFGDRHLWSLPCVPHWLSLSLPLTMDLCRNALLRSLVPAYQYQLKPRRWTGASDPLSTHPWPVNDWPNPL